MHLGNPLVRILGALLVVLVIILAAIFGASVARAANYETATVQQVNGSGYQLDDQVTPYRSALTVADSTVINSAFFGSVPEFGVLGRQNLSMSCRFSVAAQTAVFRLVGISKNAAGTNTLLGISGPIFVTATAFTDSSGHFIAPTFVFDSYASSHARLALVTPPASGTVTVWLGSY
jgi:hypothetical protein